MKNAKAITVKALLVLALFVTPAFADGDMGGGGFADDGTQPKPAPTAHVDGDMGGGGFRATEEEMTLIDAWIREISEYLGLIG